MSVPYRPMTARRGDPIPLRRIHQCVQLFVREGPWAWWLTLDAYNFGHI